MGMEQFIISKIINENQYYTSTHTEMIVSAAVYMEIGLKNPVIIL